MSETTSPDNIVKWTQADPADLQPASAEFGDSVQLALDARQMYTYRWANDAARTSQTGMRDGDQGYQVNTGYWWDRISGAWVRRYGTLITDPTGIFTEAGPFSVQQFALRVSGNRVEVQATFRVVSFVGTNPVFGTFAAGWRPADVFGLGVAEWGANLTTPTATSMTYVRGTDGAVGQSVGNWHGVLPALNESSVTFAINDTVQASAAFTRTTG